MPTAATYAIIGVKVPSASLYCERRLELMPHNHPPEFKFDPLTGRRLYKMEIVPRKEYDEANGRLLDYYVVESGGNAFITFYYAGVRLEGNCTHATLPLEPGDTVVDSLRTIHDSMKAKLEPLGLWGNEECFGLFSVHVEQPKNA